MNPSQMKEMLEQAREAQKMMEEQIKKAVEEEIKRRDLISRKEAEELIRKISY